MQGILHQVPWEVKLISTCALVLVALTLSAIKHRGWFEAIGERRIQRKRWEASRFPSMEPPASSFFLD